MFTSQLRNEYQHAVCDTSMMDRVSFPCPESLRDDGTIELLVEKHTVDAWKLFAKVMEKYGYLFREMAGGTYNCRNIAGTNRRSLHAYGIALDLNPSKNPYSHTLRTDQPLVFRRSIKRIKTGNGKQVFTWGGDWGGAKDAMHWQMDVTHEDLRTGVEHPSVDADTKPPPKKEPTETSWPERLTDQLKTLDEDRASDSYDRATAIVQALCAAHGFVAANTFNAHLQPDGIWGSGTTSAVRAFQSAKSLTVDGIVGPKTWKRITEALPLREKGYAIDNGATSVRIIQGLFAAWNRNLNHSKGDGQGEEALYDGRFGDGVESDVRGFQRARGLTVDGIVGPNTYGALFKPAT